jgi:hypothetical protein
MLCAVAFLLSVVTAKCMGKFSIVRIAENRLASLSWVLLVGDLGVLKLGFGFYVWVVGGRRGCV